MIPALFFYLFIIFNVFLTLNILYISNEMKTRRLVNYVYLFHCSLLTSCPSNGCQEDTVKAQRQSLLERKTLT